MSIEQEFREKVANYLNRLSADIKPVLETLIEYEYPEEVVSLEFEVFADGFTQEFPVRAFFMDSNNSEHFVVVDGKAEYPSPVDPDLLRIDYVYPYEFENEYIEKDSTFDPWSIATNELIEWFSKCWLAAGGEDFKLNSSIAAHDSHHVFNLKESRWQNKPQQSDKRSE